MELSLSFVARNTENKSCFAKFKNNDNIARRKCHQFRLSPHATSENNDRLPRVPPPKYYVRKARYMELGHVVDILIDAFYNPSALVRPYLYLSELSRLQGNFPYDEKVHTFYVACCMEDKEEKVIGFVDVDKREGKKLSDAPRPYLSDLAVHSKYRRMGVAKALIHNCEEESIRWGEDCLYLRVDKKNDGGLKMYEGLNYEKQEHPYFGVGRDTTILLKRKFNQKEKDNMSKRASGIDVDEREETITYVI